MDLLRVGAGHMPQSLQGPPIQEVTRIINKLHQDCRHADILARQLS